MVVVATQYVQSAFFLLLGAAAIRQWAAGREQRQAHLAWAAGLFGIAQGMLAYQATVFTQANGRIPSRAYTAAWNVLLYVALYAFLVFLADFIQYPKWGHVLAFIALAVNVVFAITLKPEIVLVGGQEVVHLNVRNPIPYGVFVTTGILYIAGTFAALATSFVRYGRRSKGVPRFRMLCIGSGFALLLVASVILPVFLSGGRDVADVGHAAVLILSLGAAPLLYVGFAPPGWVRARVGARP